MIELAMPAGSMQSALVAFRDGADAIYLGLQKFSARKKAVNFDIEEYSKIYRYAKTNNKKVYVTINTVIYDAQIDSAIKLLKQIQLIGSDGIIVQDLGIAKIIKEYFSILPLHGSTQLAVHSVQGVKEMQELGFSRVVLSRELSVKEIENIRKECSDVELKVFIHGALCYGFSGLCMASRIITNRSANAGACAQICRTWFSYNNKKGYFFSMKDLDSNKIVKELERIGIDSLKVEGRMKSPSYVSAVTKYYRAIIDNKPYEDLLEDVKTTFSRNSSMGWLKSYSEEKTNLIDNTYASHKGLYCAKVIEKKSIRNNNYALIKLKTPLAIHDGLMFLNKNKSVDNAIKFSVKAMINKSGKEIKRAKPNELIYLLLSKQENEIQVDDDLFLIKKHDQDEKLINTDRLPLSKIYSDAKFIVNNDSIKVEADLTFIGKIVAEKQLLIEKSDKAFDYKNKIEKIFKQSQNSNYEINSIDLVNNTEFDIDNIFLPLSAIKEMRRSFYNIVDEKVAAYIEKPIDFKEYNFDEAIKKLPNRSEIQINELPFYEEVPTKIEQLINYEGLYYIPLPPVFFNEKKQISNLQELVKKLKNNNLIDKVYFGLNNIAHIKWVESLNVKVFVDIYLYLANRFSAQSILDSDLNLVGAYLFLETVKGDIFQWPFIPTKVDQEFIPPLFISRTNFSYDSLNRKKEEGDYYISQRDKEYKVISNNELTYLIKRN